MEILIIVLTILTFFFIGIYISILIKFHNLFLPSLNLNSKNVLIIYPHPDDETMMSGSLIHSLAKKNNLWVVTVTKGQAGNELVEVSKSRLASIRSQEFTNATKILGVKNIQLWDFEDGGLTDQRIKLENHLKEFLIENKIDVVVTYERTGVYGHKDHVVLSKVVNSVSDELNLKVYYSTITKKLHNTINLSSKMKNLTLEDSSNISVPKYKHFSFIGFLKKYLAADQYKSQNISREYPLWLTIMVSSIEYFTDEY